MIIGLTILCFLTACQPRNEMAAQTRTQTHNADEASTKLYFFGGQNDFLAVTIDETGENLPVEHGPWTFLKSASLGDLRTNRRIDEPTLQEVRAKGFSTTQIIVTFEPSTTIPER